MAIPFLNNINLTDNQLLNAKLQVSSSAPTNAIGQIYFNTNAGENRVRVHNGTEFKAVAWYDDIPATIVESLTLNNSTFITLSNSGTATDPSITASLSASGTPSSSTFLRGDNTWATPNYYSGFTIDGNLGTTELIESGDTLLFTGLNGITTEVVAVDHLEISLITDSSSNYILSGNGTGVALANDVISFSTNIGNTVKQTTLGTIPVDSLSLVKSYIDNSVAGGLVYQGGYNAATNTPDLTTSPNSIKKGWTYTVTADGTFFGIQLRSGDVLIAEIDNPLAGVDWTIVEKNTDYASLSTIGIGNVNAGTGISIGYNGTGTATITNTNTNAVNTYATTISDTATITHSRNTRDVIIQLYDTVTFETVYADVDRISTSQATITFATTPTNSIRVLVQKIG